MRKGTPVSEAIRNNDESEIEKVLQPLEIKRSEATARQKLSKISCGRDKQAKQKQKEGTWFLTIVEEEAGIVIEELCKLFHWEFAVLLNSNKARFQRCC